MIIDIHNHLGKSTDGGESRLDDFIVNSKNYRLDKIILFAIDSKDAGNTFQFANDIVFEARDKYPDLFIAFARVNPSVGQEAVDEFKRCLSKGVRGLKLKAEDGFDTQEATEIFDLIKPQGTFPVIIHTDHKEKSTPKKWEPLIKKYPQITFIMAHGGKDRYRDCARIAQENDNTYVETSTLSYNRTKFLYRTIGADKLLFASDYPYSHPGIELEKYKVIVKDTVDLEKIYHQNARDLLDI